MEKEQHHSYKHIHEMNLANSCLMATLKLKEYNDHLPEEKTSNIILQQIVMLPEVDLKVPKSELTIRAGADDGWIIAWVLGCQGAGIIYKKHGKCSFLSGPDTEVMKPDLISYTRRLHMRHVKCQELKKVFS